MEFLVFRKNCLFWNVVRKPFSFLDMVQNFVIFDAILWSMFLLIYSLFHHLVFPSFGNMLNLECLLHFPCLLLSSLCRCFPGDF